MGFRRKTPEAPRVELTAMIDVVFLLLIFFMISTTFVERPGLSIELPTSAAESVKQQQDLHVYLTADGDIYLDRDQVDRAQLQFRLESFTAAQRKKMTFLLMADKAARHGQVVELMDLARTAGFDQLAIATDSKLDNGEAE